MDDKWFKQQQKKAGVTAEEIAERLGRDRSIVSRIYAERQPMTPEQAEVFSEVLDVPLDEVLKRAGVFSNGPPASLSQPQGFGESDASLYTPPPSKKQTTEGCARLFGGDAPGIDVWEVKTQSMQLDGYMPGDLVLVDTHQSETAKSGDIVIAQRYDWKTGSANTLMRRFEPPVLVAASAAPEDHHVHVVDGNNVVIRGKVVASWRS